MHAHETSAYRVLVVDDNEGIHADFRSLLEPKSSHSELDELASELFGEALEAPSSTLPHYQLDSAFQGKSAVQSVKEAIDRGEGYALAFVDIRMPPGLDGVETIEHIWALDPDIHMIICSAYSDYTWEQIVERLGVTDKLLFLRKPFDPGMVKQMTLATVVRWSQARAHAERISALERRRRQCQEHLDALRGAPPPPRSEVRAALHELTSALDDLSGSALTTPQRALLQRAVDVSASLSRALSIPTA